ncbi:DHS-like NAD/FAD-binding domain-containing protein [Lipomyces tetrasporus]|uniref:DHS-like NAD/FAD-binding domain-containing protein n=1 Tax=Lipomyces tetrasporus TaxID=54092 RepID=A0AAD7QML0_9ASCO|nr:DHS-like NAD/FAD-binding domain-containing protein [Lipomyces tetrasporus]KAJ8097770.1 DHS-like NAD/FAD-binding domain-containing protein [Lipomyces tetrasporus]
MARSTIAEIKDQIAVQSASSTTFTPATADTKKRKREAKLVSRPRHRGPFELRGDGLPDERYAEALHTMLRKCRRLVVVVGAGISVGAGIPDFRSSTGLFQTVKDDFKLKVSGQSMFDSSVYQDAATTSMFHSMVNTLHTLSQDAKVTKFHQMLSQLSTDNRLLRLYTQNVDCLEISLSGLETAVPLPGKAPWPKTIQLHGGLQKMVCAKCGWMASFDPTVFEEDKIPECNECKELETVREVVGKRTQGIGRLRPRIVLYNEFNPDGEAIGKVTSSDLKARPDGMLVVGTSLKVPGVRRIVKEMSSAVHAGSGMVVWINEQDPPAAKMFENCFDLILKGDCQEIPGILERWEESKTSPKRVASAKKKKKTSVSASGVVSSITSTTVSEKHRKITDVFKVKKLAVDRVKSAQLEK